MLLDRIRSRLPVAARLFRTKPENDKLDGLEPKPLLRDDVQRASAKIAVVQYLAVAVFLFLISGFWRLQIESPEEYTERAERNWIKSLPILAPRGKILDREGRVIVDNHSSFSLILSREKLKEEHLKAIAEGVNLDYDELADRLRRFRQTSDLRADHYQRRVDPRRTGVCRIPPRSRHFSGDGADPRAKAAVSEGRVRGPCHRLRG